MIVEVTAYTGDGESVHTTQYEEVVEAEMVDQWLWLTYEDNSVTVIPGRRIFEWGTITEDVELITDEEFEQAIRNINGNA